MRDLWGNEWKVPVREVRAETEALGRRHKPPSMMGGLSVIPKTPSVYFLLSHDKSVVKIGKAMNPRDRIHDIRRMNPHQLDVIMAVPGYTRVEGFFHQILSSEHSHMEWFRYQGAVIATLQKLRDDNEMLTIQLRGPTAYDLKELHERGGSRRMRSTP
jgi:hypothetical protein